MRSTPNPLEVRIEAEIARRQQSGAFGDALLLIGGFLLMAFVLAVVAGLGALVAGTQEWAAPWSAAVWCGAAALIALVGLELWLGEGVSESLAAGADKEDLDRRAPGGDGMIYPGQDGNTLGTLAFGFDFALLGPHLVRTAVRHVWTRRGGSSRRGDAAAILRRALEGETVRLRELHATDQAAARLLIAVDLAAVGAGGRLYPSTEARKLVAWR